MQNSVDRLTTERLALRRWRDADREPLAAIHTDPAVMEFLPGPLSRVESDALIDRIETHFDEHGFGWWAVELRETGELLGFVGLMVPGFDAHFTPCVEIGWRLARTAWGHGYATEAAHAAIQSGFGTQGFHEIVSFTVPHNTRSRRVMERLGMVHDPADDFDHPRLAEGHPLRRHVLYRLQAPLR